MLYIWMKKVYTLSMQHKNAFFNSYFSSSVRWTAGSVFASFLKHMIISINIIFAYTAKKNMMWNSIYCPGLVVAC